MYSFKVSDKISLCYNDTEVLSDIKLWINTVLTPQDDKTSGEKTYCEYVKSDRKSVLFKTKTAKFTLSLKEGDGCFAVFLKGGHNVGDCCDVGTHLRDFSGLGFDFSLNFEGNYVAHYMRCAFWQKPLISSSINELKYKTQALLFKQDGENSALFTVCDKNFKSVLNPNGDRVELALTSNTVCDEIDECVLIGAKNKDEFEIFDECVKYGARVMKKRVKMRSEKEYPEVLEYLGWCSWDAFHMDITAENLLQKAQEFKEKQIPVKWFIIDDMWGDVSGIDRRTMHSRELNDWEADPKRFPNGLKGAISDVKEKYDLKIGIWHPISGYWNGVNPCGNLAKREKDLLEYTISSTPKLMHSFDKRKILRYYDRQHAFYKKCGVDFTKVDNQGSMISFSRRKGTIGECAKNLHSAIEKTAEKYYNGGLINCMGMPIENFWNRKSVVNRFSGDFMPEDRKWFIQHLLQCSYNCLSQGTLYVGDWDMWWSDDKQAKKNAVLRSMSGGPIYVSDRLDCSVKEVIMPTVYENGRIIRLSSPALPTRDCLFEDCEHNQKIFKVFNKIGDCGVIAAFNLDEDEREVGGVVKVSDVEGLRAGKYCVYDWFNKTAVVLKNDELELSLKDYDDFRLFIIVPIEKNRAVIGILEKYMAPATVSVSGDVVSVNESGTLLVYSERNLLGFEKVSDNLFKKTVRKGDEVIL